tara:strand:- start:978 stop:1580 length:603 start_codon:yes stop_codon:yes gene_type:complete
MFSILQSLPRTINLSAILALLLFLGLYLASDGFTFDRYFFSWLFRYFHVLSGVMWIGLLWYLNFVQIPSMPKISDEQKPAITKVIAPKVLFWFRWAAIATILTGLLVAYLNGYLYQSIILGIGSDYGKNTAIGIGMWLGIIMAYNVWFIIWPNQKKALGIVDCNPEEKQLAARKALITSRINTLLSLPMLLTMVAAQNLY